MQSTTSRALVLGAALALVSACQTTTTDTPDTGSTPGTDTGTVPTTDTGTTPGTDTGTAPVDAAARTDGGPWQTECRTLTFPTLTVGPGVEDTQCVILDLGNDQPMHVGAIHNVLGAASHHFIVYRASAASMLQETPMGCQPFVDTLSSDSGSPLMITQRHDEQLTLPPGVAYTLPAHQLIRLELHYINVTAAPVDVAPTSEICPISDESFTDEADFLFIGNPDVNVPARSAATLGPTFYQLDRRFADANFFAITGHTHQFGTNVVVQTGAAEAGPFTDVYNVPGWSWQEPETVFATTPFQIPAGGGFNFTCSWNNPTSSDVGFGESAYDEMCFFWAYYYPAHAGAPHVCVHTDQVPGGFDICCPGSPLCDRIVGAL